MPRGHTGHLDIVFRFEGEPREEAGHLRAEFDDGKLEAVREVTTDPDAGDLLYLTLQLRAQLDEDELEALPLISSPRRRN